MRSPNHWLMIASLAVLAGCVRSERAGFLSPATPGTANAAARTHSSLAFTHVNVVDATGAPAKLDMTVLVVGDRIKTIGKAGKVKVPKEAHTMDATGKFLIPGLWDMHVHVLDEKPYLQLFTANGITGIRQMSGDQFGCTNVLQWRREGSTDAMIIPRMVLGSPVVDGPNSWSTGSIVVTNEAEARQVVVRLKGEGWDFVKVYFGLSREAYLAIADEAKKQAISFAGHVPSVVNAGDASDTGQKCMEHLWGILAACSSREAEIRASTNIADIATPPLAMKTYGESKAEALFARLARNGTWQCPTLTMWRGLGWADDASFASDPRLKYVPPDDRRSWIEKKAFPLNYMTAESYAFQKRAFQKYSSVVCAMRQAGVPLIAGTDALNPYSLLGFGLHDELQLLVQAGLTPMEALQAATRNAAKFNGTLADLGTIEKGKLADLVLLDANPLEDIRNTQKIRAVIAGGRLLDRKALDDMLAQVEALANRK